ncbi:WD40 repeat-like protein [Conidiobolus coronatus NRRL 28638]|uniref:WD40 repeat-like protein n=1 Tax=Conidiobolus coronatus (strain ATCC 28846 / CBS 209.66 / NRRL 28638) TaxID=796925 RepID=A0A137P729_CONC2|nr:WD40 repeat-like protein [Conidiobolus coronatus NRRL 28638]|eukprot:KXN70810.1 WD40 repeat-like protein [Conidiobolus coronatus NRRL 28638]
MSSTKTISDSDFKNFYLKRIIKENHNNFIQQIQLCPGSGYDESSYSCGNLLASIGANQLNIYDNEHIGNHLDLMSHMVLDEEDEETILSSCWLLPPQDCWIVLGGTEGYIHAISLAYSQEIIKFKPHSDDITQILSHPNLTYYCLTTNIENSLILTELKIKSTSSVFSPCGNIIYFGNQKGQIFQSLLNCEFNSKDETNWSIEEPELIYNGRDHGNASIDSINITQNGNIIFKANNGKLASYNLLEQKMNYIVTIKNGGYHRSSFGLSKGEEYLTIGNEVGNILIYRTSTGQLLQTLKHKRSSKPVKCAIFGNNNTNIIYCSEGFIWRYDYLDDKILQEWENLNKMQQ